MFAVNTRSARSVAPDNQCPPKASAAATAERFAVTLDGSDYTDIAFAGRREELMLTRAYILSKLCRVVIGFRFSQPLPPDPPES